MNIIYFSLRLTKLAPFILFVGVNVASRKEENTELDKCHT
ncbi:hypothetical protein XBKQ1_430016 [Xenorhabdus bovienii str. kraussei Quebec]|uniref:Uncharacterized protein n=1 Tax=Xenorhabdus bovienii str. kraussei Quebec TaxID=1398203 RepID=A0A077PK86_XENBV|nr:hypothetical protein XBKQ1_430016 [Xenorhabdus bovienii str. kraussei Quebec]